MTLSEILQHFPDHRRSGGGYEARCPAHQDKNPSLMVSQGKKGIVLYCHGGCTNEAVLQAVGLTLADLYPTKTTPPKKNGLGKPDKIWKLQNTKGTLIAEHYRWDRPDGKELRWRNGNGAWGLAGLKTKELPLYNSQALPSYDKHAPTFLCEGEKDTDAVLSLRVQAIGTVTGADGCPSPEILATLEGFTDLRLLPDNDAQGAKHMKRLALELYKQGTKVGFVTPEDLPKGGGAFDWLEQQKQAGPRSLEQLRQALVALPRDYASGEDVAPALGREKTQTNAPTPKGNGDPGPSASWRAELLRDLQTDSKGQALGSAFNVALVLAKDAHWNGILAFNEFSQKVVALRPPPWDAVVAPAKEPVPGAAWTDEDDIRLAVWLSHHWNIKVSSAVVAEISRVAARRNSFHPIRRYLEGLCWDGKERLSSWLSVYLGAPTDEYTKTAGMRWLISAVARIYEPGCKADYVLIAEGPQGKGKSSAFEVLGGVWFSDELGDLTSKDAALQLQGRWIIEIAELGALSRQEEDRNKHFLSKKADRFRPPYGRSVQDFPRQCIFCGTTNKVQYLKDETGGRRYLPVKVGEIDLETLRLDAPQLWAEATEFYRQKVRWWPTPQEAKLAADEQEGRYQEDPWEEVVLRWLADTSRSFATIGEVLNDALLLPKAQQHQKEAIRVAQIFSRLGWERRRSPSPDASGRRPWRYTAPAPTPKTVAEPVPVSGTETKTGTETGTAQTLSTKGLSQCPSTSQSKIKIDIETTHTPRALAPFS